MDVDDGRPTFTYDPGPQPMHPIAEMRIGTLKPDEPSGLQQCAIALAVIAVLTALAIAPAVVLYAWRALL